MRFTLRNQDKIEQAFCKNFLEEILGDLKFYFNSHSKIEQYNINFRYPIIKVPRRERDEIHIFYVYGGKYDVLNLAYKETIRK